MEFSCLTAAKRGVAVRLEDFQTPSGTPTKGLLREWERWLKDGVPVAVIWSEERARSAGAEFVLSNSEDYHLRIENARQPALISYAFAPRLHDPIAYPIGFTEKAELDDLVRFEKYESAYEKLNLQVYYLDCPRRLPRPSRVITRNPYGELDDELDYGDHSSDVEYLPFPTAEGRKERLRIRKLRQYVVAATRMKVQMDAARLSHLYPPPCDVSEEAFDLFDLEEIEKLSGRIEDPIRRKVEDDYDPEPECEEGPLDEEESDYSMGKESTERSYSDMELSLSGESVAASFARPTLEQRIEGSRKSLWERLGPKEGDVASERAEGTEGTSTPTVSTPMERLELWKRSIANDPTRYTPKPSFDATLFEVDEAFLRRCEIQLPASTQAWLLDLALDDPGVTWGTLCSRALANGCSFRLGFPLSFEQYFAEPRRKEVQDANERFRTPPFWTNDRTVQLLEPPIRITSDLSPFRPPQVAIANDNRSICVKYRTALDHARYDPRLPLMLEYGGYLWRIATEIGPGNLANKILRGPSDNWAVYQVKAEFDRSRIYETYANPADDPLVAILIGKFDKLQGRSIWPPPDLFYNNQKWTGVWTEANETWFIKVWEEIKNKTAVAQAYARWEDNWAKPPRTLSEDGLATSADHKARSIVDKLKAEGALEGSVLV